MSTVSKVLVLIDYDNITDLQKISGIRSLVENALSIIPFKFGAEKNRCEIRLYGGWFEDVNMTVLAQKIVTELISDFPVLMRFSQDGRTLAVECTAELASSMMQDPSSMIFNTFRKKSKPSNIKVADMTDVGCAHTSCMLPSLKILLKKGKCSVSGCSVGSELVYRQEQKIVDTMLTCDLIHSVEIHDAVILISSDDDFIPPIKMVSSRGLKLVRVHPKKNSRRVFLSIKSANFYELEL